MLVKKSRLCYSIEAMNTTQEIWNGILNLLKKEGFSQTALDTWFASAELVNLDNNSAVICAANKLGKQVLEDRFGDNLRKAFSELFCQDFIIDVICGEDQKEKYNARKEGKEGLRALTIPAYRFEDFKVAESNRFAYMVAKAAAENPEDENCGPLFIYGPAGIGKTHLLCAIAMEIHEHFPGKKITYLSGDEFTNRLVMAIKEHTTDRFRDEFRTTDVLLIDNVQFIVGKSATQEEFFNTFNALHDSGKLIVMASDMAPKEMPVLENKMRTRFESGILADIKIPEQQLRYDVIKEKCEALGVKLTEDELTYFAGKKITSIRQIEGLIKSLAAHAKIFGKVGIDVLDKVLDSCALNEDAGTDDADILNETAKYYEVTEEQMKGPSRARNISCARQVAMYLMRTELDMTLEQVGEVFKRDHATVINSVNKVDRLVKSKDESILKAIRAVKKKLSARAA